MNGHEGYLDGGAPFEDELDAQDSEDEAIECKECGRRLRAEDGPVYCAACEADHAKSQAEDHAA